MNVRKLVLGRKKTTNLDIADTAERRGDDYFIIFLFFLQFPQPSVRPRAAEGRAPRHAEDARLLPLIKEEGSDRRRGEKRKNIFISIPVNLTLAKFVAEKRRFGKRSWSAPAAAEKEEGRKEGRRSERTPHTSNDPFPTHPNYLPCVLFSTLLLAWNQVERKERELSRHTI